MKRLLMITVMTVIAVVTFAQSNNLLWTMTVDVKMDKKLEWEKKMLTFVKTHMPQVKYRVWEVISGTNTGAYVIVMGPTSYKEMDVPNVSPKGEALMRTDGQGLDALCNWSKVNYYNIVDALSPAKPDRKLKYQVATFSEINMGTWGDVSDFLAHQKEAREKGESKSDYIYLRPSNSGAGNAFVSIRFIEKMEELDGSASTFNMAESYDKTFGNNSWYKDYNNYMSMIKSNRTEIRVLRADLSNL